jgi:hypothetical protein
MALPIKTYADIMALRPCYDPAERGYIPRDWTGTALDILRIETAPVRDRFWLVLRDDWIDARIMRLFAVWCARQALALIDQPDPRSVAACDVAERYANGEATSEELAAARAAARDAAGAAAWDAAWDAAGDAAWDAAGAAARDAAWDAQNEKLTEMLMAEAYAPAQAAQ